jgi:hypothetical protein
MAIPLFVPRHQYCPVHYRSVVRRFAFGIGFFRNYVCILDSLGWQTLRKWGFAIPSTIATMMLLGGVFSFLTYLMWLGKTLMKDVPLTSQPRLDMPEQEMYVIPVLGCIAFLLLAAFVRLPYGAYEWLRIVIFFMSGWLSIESLRLHRQVWAVLLAANAILFNFIIPMHMSRAHWKNANLISAVLLAVWVGNIFFKKPKL